MLDRRVKIYCSNRTNPVYKVQLSDTTHKGEENVLNLAYLQVPGYEHYDACTPSVQKTKAQQNETPTSSESSASVTHDSITPRKQAEYKSPPKFKVLMLPRVSQKEFGRMQEEEKRCQGLISLTRIVFVNHFS